MRTIVGIITIILTLAGVIWATKGFIQILKENKEDNRNV